ncbi:helix-turn-helix transcriptional regulator [Conexibacter sp. DBS9H8]|uniref:helix-turn-helix domain-containing protein n=1 Tax=Conexibacter sp. DBS9H8 TaxID=2937801 RepID=UPI00200C7F0B|nr:helix-turn-helix domain-containing protein [Conexibacter sp. DBS9H8]
MAEIGPNIGATLRETRMRARIDIGEVEMATKIRAKYLRAIENEEWDLLPGPIYAKSFLRTYGDYLGLDSRLLIDEYRRRFELVADTPMRPLSAVKRDRERERARALSGPVLPSWAIIALVLVAAGVGLYLIGRGNGNTTPRLARGITPTQPRPHHSARRRPNTTGGAAGSLTSTTGTSTGASTVTTGTGTGTNAGAAPGTAATLQLTPSAPVWVCVETPAGAKLVDGVTEQPGATLPTLSGRELLVTLGNAHVTVTANGRSYPLTASATAIGLKITSAGVSLLPQGPTCA